MDEDELDDELMEFERELAQEKKKNTNMNMGQKQNIPASTNQQQQSYKNQDIESFLKGI